MKKNAMMKIAAILMVAVLLTTCAISSTFAKYVTGDEGSASARVAKWGVNIDITTDDVFGLEYTMGTAKDVVVLAGEPVIAPGTKNLQAITISASGTPEVAAQLTVNDGTKDDDDEYIGTKNFFAVNDAWEYSDNTDYCPVIFYVNDVTYQMGTLEDVEDVAYYYDSVSALIAGVNAAITELFDTYRFDPSDDDAEIAADVTIGWEWPFEVDNVKDTYLGDQADAGNEATITFGIYATVEQIGPSDALTPANP